jgi:hypothetical protein
VLLDDIRGIADQPLTLAGDDLAAEWANTVWLDAGSDVRSVLSVDEVVGAFLETARALDGRVRAMSLPATATFYVWHDEQAGQLRCSVSSQPPTNLPFGGAYRPTGDLDAVIVSFLNDRSPGTVSWQDLQPADEMPAESDDYPPFPVWTFNLGTLR